MGGRTPPVTATVEKIRRCITWLTVLVATFAVVLGAVASQPTTVSAATVIDAAWAWGDNTYGQLGDGTTTSRSLPSPPSGLTNVISIAAGYYHNLALTADGTVWAWGDNSRGQLGNGTMTQQVQPVQVSGLTNVIAISAGVNHSLALTSDGTVWAWGDNSRGQLGNGTTTQQILPVQVSDLTNLIAISAGDFHSLALRDDGTVWSWGFNGYGQLGDGTTTDRLTPVQVNIPQNITALSAGTLHSLALTSDGTIWSWGHNVYGQLGDGTTTSQLAPVQVNGLPPVTAIDTGETHSVALLDDGTVWSWGYNRWGQLGDGTTIQQVRPVQVSGLTNVTAITAGTVHTLAIRADGSTWGWGDNGKGQLGDGTTARRTVPVQVNGLPNATSITAGRQHSVALTTGPASTDVPMSVSAFTVKASKTTDGYKLSTGITVQTNGNPVSGAVVRIAYTDPDGTTATQMKMTNSTGLATFSRLVTTPGGYVVSVTSIIKAVHRYDPSGDVSSSRGVVVGASSGPKLYVTKISLASTEVDGGWMVTGKVTVKAGSGVASGATVSATLIAPDGTVVSVPPATTNQSGIATLAQMITMPGTYELVITDIQLSGFSYNANFNTITSKSVTIAPMPAGPMYVGEMTLTAVPLSTGHQLTATVTVEASGIQLGGSSVTLRYTYPNGSIVNQTKKTDATGVATFTRAVSIGGTYEVTVMNVTRINYSYDATQNLVTTQSITLS